MVGFVPRSRSWSSSAQPLRASSVCSSITMRWPPGKPVSAAWRGSAAPSGQAWTTCASRSAAARASWLRVCCSSCRANSTSTRTMISETMFSAQNLYLRDRSRIQTTTMTALLRAWMTGMISPGSYRLASLNGRKRPSLRVFLRSAQRWQTEEASCAGGGVGCQFRLAFLPMQRHFAHDLGKKGRLVLAALRFGAQGARQQVGRVGFEHQQPLGNLAHQRLQVSASAFVADPAGDADVQVEIQVGIECALVAGEAVHHGRAEMIAEGPQDLHQALGGVALMEEYRPLGADGQFQMRFEYPLLLRARREVAVEVQPAFAHCTHLRLGQQGAQLRRAVGRPFAGLVRMNAGGAEQMAAFFVQRAAQPYGGLAVGKAGAGQHQLLHPGGVGAVECRAWIPGECGVGKIDADIDQLHVRPRARNGNQ